MVTVVGYAVTNTGVQIPLRNDSVTNGTEFTLQTDSNVTTTAQDIGTYAPGQMLTAVEVFAPSSISYAYILRQGTILSWASVNSAGVNNMQQSLCAPVLLRPGDQIRVLSLSATARNSALCVYTAQGGSKIVSSGSAWIRNASAQVVGLVPATNPQNAEPMISDVNVPIELNWTATVVTSS
jgi:hypothetical protein